MPPSPLHPAIVHLPLGLAFVMPLVATFLAWDLWTGRGDRHGWTLVVALRALLLGGGLLALETGQGAEALVERVVPRAAVHEHEEYAEQLLWASGLVLGLASTALAARERRAAVVAGLAVATGHAGGNSSTCTGRRLMSTRLQHQGVPSLRQAARQARATTTRGDDRGDVLPFSEQAGCDPSRLPGVPASRERAPETAHLLRRVCCEGPAWGAL